jgi:hypothetical protein
MEEMVPLEARVTRVLKEERVRLVPQENKDQGVLKD